MDLIVEIEKYSEKKGKRYRVRYLYIAIITGYTCNSFVRFYLDSGYVV